jgi:hypothetical protein
MAADRAHVSKHKQIGAAVRWAMSNLRLTG